MIKIRKAYREINPELLFAEIKDFALKQGAKLGSTSMETYTLPDESANFISRGTLTFVTADKSESIRAHIVGSPRTDTKMMLDINEALFPQDKIDALMEDIGFIFGSRETEPNDDEEED